MAQIYSTKLAFGSTSSGGSTTVYTAPTGMVVVIRTVSLIAHSGGSIQLNLQVVSGPNLLGIESPGSFLGVPYDMRHVINGGDQLEVYNSSGGMDWAISGYVLT